MNREPVTGDASGAPGYGRRALSDLLPAMAATIDVPGYRDVLGLPAAHSAVLLLVDGLGAALVEEHADCAPVLAGRLAGRSLDAGFPSSTSISVASIGTGLPPGAHGLVGLTMNVDGQVLDTLRWTVGGHAATALAPELVQPRQTVFEGVAAAGRRAVVVSSALYEGSSLTRAALRGAPYVPTVAHGDLVAAVLDAARSPGTLCYAYVSELDAVGHRCGPGSLAWRLQLAEVDRLVEMLLERLPAGTLLVVTGDHGMVTLDQDRVVDYDARPELAAGVDLIAGEPRVRYLHTTAGADSDVRAAWESLGSDFRIRSRGELIDAGWFGPEVGPAAQARIGDLVVTATGRGAVVRRSAEPTLSGLIGHHGAATDAERRVALFVASKE